MTDEEMLSKLTNIIYACMPELRGTKLYPDTVINRDLGVDSMNFVMIICKIEAQFNIRVPDEEWQRLSTVQDVMNEIRSLQASGVQE